MKLGKHVPMRHHPLTLTIAMALVVGCSTTPPAFPPSSLNPSRLSASVASGRSSDLGPGHPHAFWVWQDSDGLWHVRTTAKRRDHRFQGVLRPLDGAEIVDLRTVSLDQRDRIGMIGRALSFEFHTTTQMDGFDFRLNRPACLEFDLRMDEDGTPRYVFLGKDKFVPDGSHFILCP